MSKLTKRKSENQIGKQMPSYYELQKEAKQQADNALEVAKSQDKPVKYLINTKLWERIKN